PDHQVAARHILLTERQVCRWLRRQRRIRRGGVGPHQRDGGRAPQGKLSPRLAALKPGDEVQVVSDASGFFVLDEVPDCETLWML
ncbi:hypothetical protein ONJ16_26805, partial [Salmonella enterica subsp. enterica serovar Montevideo]|nr:hypothetical protein [Salmonella enterica subsp. enterica serovar Montevideo]